MKFNFSSIKEWSLKKKIGYGFLTFIILVGIFSGGDQNPDDLLKEMNNSKDNAQISELSKKFEKIAEIKNYSSSPLEIFSYRLSSSSIAS